jgi:hypothetical protein
MFIVGWEYKNRTTISSNLEREHMRQRPVRRIRRIHLDNIEQIGNDNLSFILTVMCFSAY